MKKAPTLWSLPALFRAANENQRQIGGAWVPAPLASTACAGASGWPGAYSQGGMTLSNGLGINDHA